VWSRALVLLVGAVLLGGCGGGASPELQALKDDPLGRYEPPGGRLIDSTERDAGSSLGKPIYPEYRRMFGLPQGDPERQLEHAAAAAAAVGWLMSEPEHSPVGGAIVSFGDKRLSTGRASAGITLFPNGPPSGETSEPTLLLRLRNFG
jgi:hypothetical protein